jgi:hypothetical protein
MRSGKIVGLGGPYIAAAAIACALQSFSGRAEAAGGAYIVDDADIGKAGSCQNEAWMARASNRDFTAVTSPACVVDIGIPVELAAVYQRTGAGHEWATTVGGQAKIVPIDNDRFAWSLSGGISRDLTLHRSIAFVNMPVTLKFGPNFRTHVNAGWIYDGRVDVNYVTGGIGFDWDFRPKFSLMGEVYLQDGERPPSIPRSVHEPRLQLGLRYIPIETVDIDLIYGRNVTGRDAHWLTMGLTVRSQ